jgi:hypothetical protein
MWGPRAEFATAVALVLAATVIDLLSEAVQGLWPAALSILIGRLFIWRTEQEMERGFTGPERHRPWLHATGWFFILVGLFGIVLSLLPLLGF